MNSRELSVEASLQAKEIKKLEKWVRMLLSVSSIFLVAAYWGIQGKNIRFVIGIAGIILTVLCFVFAAIVNLGIKKARGNVKRISELAEKDKI